MPTASRREFSRAWAQALRQRAEAKAAVRRVRTPEGARKFGEAIGEVIVPNATLVDFIAERPLTGPEARPITTVLKRGHVPYESSPFVEPLLDLLDQGPQTDPWEHEHGRRELFDRLPEVDVRIADLIPTQPTFNEPNVRAKLARRDRGEEYKRRNAYVARVHGELYLVDGHHGVVADALHGDDTTAAHLLDLDALGGYDEKARHVRTPEGARRYGVPIGTLITPDLAPRPSTSPVPREVLEEPERSDPPQVGFLAGNELLQAAQTQARAKFEALPPIDQQAVEKHRAMAIRIKEGKLRAGGELRGNSRDRARSRLNLFKEFGGEDRGWVPCVYCGVKLHHEDGHGLPKLTRDKMRTFTEGGGYQLFNLLPACGPCNASRNDTSFVEAMPR